MAIKGFPVYSSAMVREVIDQKEAIAELCRVLGVERLFLFGSAVQGTRLAEVGDLDFLVRFKPLPPAEYADNYFLLLEKLEDLFRAPVDLVEMDQIRNPYFREAVDESMVPVYETA